MKLINKIFCLFLVFVLCLPVMCLPVGAEETSAVDPVDYYLTGGTGDFSGVTIKEYDWETSKEKANNIEYPEYAFKFKEKGEKKKFAYYDMTDSISRLKLGLSHIYCKSDGVAKDFYYFYRYGFDENREYFIITTYFSFSPLTVTADKFDSDTEIYCITFLIKNSGYTIEFLYNKGAWSGYTSFQGNDIRNDTDYNIVFNDKRYNTYYQNCQHYDIEWIDTYTNCDLIYNGTNLRNEPLKKFSEQIDVKLTPEFSLDMDRVFDKNTGQNDYFKFEVTNNSDTNIQFSASIIDEKTDRFKEAISGTILDGFITFDYKEWEEGYWNYVGDTQYYGDCYKMNSKFFGLSAEYTRYSELRKGNFYWILLKPGEKFEDYIYWENVNIKENVKYSFIVDCIPTGLDYPTEIFYGFEGNTKIFSHPDAIKDKNYERDATIEKYSVNYDECEQVCNYVFSVTSIPFFSTTVRGGNAKITSGWKDTILQSTNPYYREDTRTGDIIPVKNYQEFNGNMPDVDVSLDNLSVENVKSYITYSQNFFTLVKSVFTFAPGLWILICFGLTAIIIIAVVRYVRG